MTNAEVIAEGLKDFAALEDCVQEIIADYIDCPSVENCAWDGESKHKDVCTECKVKWLMQEWDS